MAKSRVLPSDAIPGAAGTGVQPASPTIAADPP